MNSYIRYITLALYHAFHRCIRYYGTTYVSSKVNRNQPSLTSQDSGDAHAEVCWHPCCFPQKLGRQDQPGHCDWECLEELQHIANLRFGDEQQDFCISGLGWATTKELEGIGGPVSHFHLWFRCWKHVSWHCWVYLWCLFGTQKIFWTWNHISFQFCLRCST